MAAIADARLLPSDRFFAFWSLRGYFSVSPARGLIPPLREWTQPRYLTEAEYKRLLAVVRHEPRDAALIELLLQTGLRLAEVSRLTLGDIDLPQKNGVGHVRVLGKGRRSRTISLNSKAAKALTTYLHVRPHDTDDSHVFLTRFKRGIGPRSIENVVSKYLKEAGIRNASVHTLRHTFGTQMALRKVSLVTIRDMLGHADIKTTSIYVGLARELMDREVEEHAL